MVHLVNGTHLFNKKKDHYQHVDCANTHHVMNALFELNFAQIHGVGSRKTRHVRANATTKAGVWM